MQDLPLADIAGAPAEALKRSSATKLVSGQKLRGQISAAEPIVQLSEDQNHRSGYQLFFFRPPENGLYRLELRSLCDCLGFTKAIMVPVAWLMKEDGTVVSDAPSDFAQFQASYRDGESLPYHFEYIWDGELSADEGYYILVAADNRHNGGTVGTLRITSATGWPYGQFTIKITPVFPSSSFGR